jgi:hypothetical protein
MTCGKCQLSHARLGVQIAGRVLHRRVTKDSQRVRAFGGGYAFTAQFWDAHDRDFDALVVEDTARGETWRADRRALAGVLRECLGGPYGVQMILPCARMTRDGAPRIERELVSLAEFGKR